MDIIIAGAGPAGLTAGIYCARGGMSTTVFDKTGPGGEMAFSEIIENYPGFPEGVSGMELSGLMEKQAKKFNARIKTEEIIKIIPGPEAVAVHTEREIYSSSALILALGSFPRKLDVPGEKELTGRGVSYCALCDGAFFAGKKIAVIGGGDTAVHEAIMLSKFAEKIYLIHRRRTLRAARTLQDKFFKLANVEFSPGMEVDRINGEKSVESITLRETNSKKLSVLKLSGVFIAAGYTPDTGFIGGAVPLDDKGYVITDRKFKAGAPGVFACGDVVSGNLKQVVSACGSAAVAAAEAVEYVENLKGISYAGNKAV